MFDLILKITYDLKGLFIHVLRDPIGSSNAEVEICIGLGATLTLAGARDAGQPLRWAKYGEHHP
jgi:hypothetical protein